MYNISFSFSSFSSGSGANGTRPHDITSRQGLTNLYNSGVSSVEHVKRPLGGSGGAIGIQHSGVVVTTNSGDRWLVHKGSGYGDSSNYRYFIIHNTCPFLLSLVKLH